METTSCITGAWRLIGVPVCAECNDEQILNRREINAFWQAVDHAIEEWKEGNYGNKGPSGGEPLEEPCHGTQHDCVNCGVDFRELTATDPKIVVEFTERTYKRGGCDSKRRELAYCGETCAREDLEDRWSVVEQIIQDETKE